MLLTGTRAAFLGLAAGAVVWSFYLAQAFRLCAGGTLRVPSPCSSLAGAFYFSPAGQPLRSRARWFAEDPWGGARPLLWRDSLRMGLGAPAGRVWTRNLHR